MTDTQDPLTVETKTKLAAIAAAFDQRVAWLESEGLLTSLDRSKLQVDALQGSQAVVRALGRYECSEEMRTELVNRLIIQFEQSVEDILSNAELRLFTDNYIENKLNEIDHIVLTNHQVEPRKWLSDNSTQIARLHKDFERKLRLQLREEQREIHSIEDFFEQYSEAVGRLIVSLRPRVTEQVNRKVSEPTSVKQQPKATAKESKGDTMEPTLIIDEKNIQDNTAVWSRLGSLLRSLRKSDRSQ